MAVAYGAIASYGFRVMPTFIARIEDATGQTLYVHRPNPRLVIDPEHAVIMVNLMQHIVNRGTGRAIRAFGFEGAAAGKTGTTNDNTDAWFTGFTPDLVASVWIGFDNREGGRRLIEKRSRRQITGGSGAAPIWAAFMKSIGKPSHDFITPIEVAAHTVNLRSGIADTSDGAVTLVLPEGVAPNTPADTLKFFKEIEFKQ